jgi:hypothetical protein
MLAASDLPISFALSDSMYYWQRVNNYFSSLVLYFYLAFSAFRLHLLLGVLFGFTVVLSIS